MASTLQVAVKTSMLATSPRRSSQTPRRTSFSPLCSASATNNGETSSRPPRRKYSIRDRLASWGTTPQKKSPNRPVNSGFLPDLYNSPELMAAPAELERYDSYREDPPENPPPDVPSMLLHNRIVYIGMPLVSAVSELIIAQLLYLQWDNPKEPIYIHINSTGTVQDDNEPVALETEGFAIYDIMMQMGCQINTLSMGVAVGQACLLLAAGTKGRRFSFPLARVMIQQPRIPAFGSLPASEVDFHAKEAAYQRDVFVKLMAKHTGNSVETVANAIRLPCGMDAIEAKEFGIIDKILWRGSEKMMKEAPREHWDQSALEESED